MRMTVDEVTELAIHIEKRNLEKCQERGATPYRTDGLRVDVWDLGEWREGETHPSKAALARWEAAKATRAEFIPAGSLARMASPPWNARVVRLRPTPGGGIDFYTGPNWRREGGPERGAEADVIRRMADDDATIIDTDLISLLRLLEAEEAAEADAANAGEADLKSGNQEGNGGWDGFLSGGPAGLGSGKLNLKSGNQEGNGDANAERLTPDAERLTPDGAGAVAMIPTAELEGHPKALAFWPDSEQRRESVEAIRASVRAFGVRQPLTVCPRPGGGWLVLDGCTRLEAAREAGIAALQCRVTGAGGEDVDDEIFISNMERTRFPSAVRIMRYLERNADAVTATAERNADQAARGAAGGRGNKAGLTETGFSAEAIAARLKVAKQDVVAGVELLRCRVGGMTVRIPPTRNEPRYLAPADEDEREAVEAAYRACLDGAPLRRWVPAAKGHGATADKARKEIRYAALFARSMTSLQNCFAHWDEISEADRELQVKDWKKVIANSPAEIMAATRRLLPPL